jgi:hypothetical protein
MNNLKRSLIFLCSAVLLTFGINRNAMAQPAKTGTAAPEAQQPTNNETKKAASSKKEISKKATVKNSASGVVVKSKEMKKQAGVTTTKVEKATREKASSTK